MSIYATKGKCQWCQRQTDKMQKVNFCDHQICDRCFINDTKCQSKCPRCWESNIEKFLKDARICSGKTFGVFFLSIFCLIVVCLTELKNKDSSLKCNQKHSICSNCYSQGCVPCQFRDLYACFYSKSTDLSADKQRIFNECQTWQELYERQTHLKQSNGDENNSENESGLLTFFSIIKYACEGRKKKVFTLIFACSFLKNLSYLQESHSSEC